MDRMDPKKPEHLKVVRPTAEVKEGQYGIKEIVEVINFVEKASLALAEGLRDGLQVTDILQVIGRYHRELLEALGGSDRVVFELKDLGPSERMYLVGRLIDLVAALGASLMPDQEMRLSVTADALKQLILAWTSEKS